MLEKNNTKTIKERFHFFTRFLRKFYIKRRYFLKLISSFSISFKFWIEKVSGFFWVDLIDSLSLASLMLALIKLISYYFFNVQILGSFSLFILYFGFLLALKFDLHFYFKDFLTQILNL